MSGPKFYRPKRKADLVRHLAAEHPADVRVPIVEHRWTVEALVELHDGIHRNRVVSEEKNR